jgi:hypothetical protein
MRNESLRILEDIIKPVEELKPKKKRRTVNFLRPIDGLSCDWFMFVPVDFNCALSIQETTRITDKGKVSEWSQGGLFSFAAGDVIYDTEKAYQNWTAALKHVRFCLQVVEAAPVLGVKTIEGLRISGKVTFKVLKNNDKGTGLDLQGTYSTTQDDFVRLLIDGSCSVVDLKSTQEERLLG